MTRYTTLDDAISREIIPALGDYAHLYDIDAIAAEAFQYRADVDSHGRVLLNTAGFELVATGIEFWETVARHEIDR